MDCLNLRCKCCTMVPGLLSLCLFHVGAVHGFNALAALSTTPGPWVRKYGLSDYARADCGTSGPRIISWQRSSMELEQLSLPLVAGYAEQHPRPVCIHRFAVLVVLSQKCEACRDAGASPGRTEVRFGGWVSQFR
ncbi:uncharacterized protein B0I36DRAFT_326773 [Microdochium trichocladiopsis]|uniref:Secreted protein n=1 Tax=Microdochium trichocladiopsis TaxID=1682393 RepID=A0A9P9BKP5_9PEZI|nr:uncharacterized protein B0I36DRAFT_326773 [Microdochium trichocladiopsis]KAH7027262.1 hypothetical protein B0I36DRAFT_326773 [Microdochium trichocladiopsis]